MSHSARTTILFCKAAIPRGVAAFILATTLWITTSGCAITATRPVQTMADTAAAIRAAKEVQADVLSPDLFRQANEWFFKARRNYRFKNFKEAKAQADMARGFAEQAEYESLRNGARPGAGGEIDPYAPVPGEPAAQPEPVPSFEPYAYPTPEPVPARPLDDTPAAPAPAPAPTPTAP